ncbi:MAG TPA: ATP-binding protein [Acidimicrobiales bacterium]|jgi:signal transduction histidine kinase/CheY-like chemotaxis protein|nr:ATP-binding protein [Acidimicrobiales bacterium]
MTAGVVIVGFAASIAVFVGARDSVMDTNNELLRQDAAQGALVLNQVINTLTPPYQQLGRIVTPAGVSASTFEVAAISLTPSGSSIALLQVGGGRLSVLASVGDFHRDLSAGSDSSLVSTLAGLSHANFAGAFSAKGMRYLEMVYGTGYVPAGFAIYSEQPIGKANAVTSLSGVAFPGTYAAVFIGSVTPANLALQTTQRLPGTDGRQVALSVITDPGNNATGATLVRHPGSVVSPGHAIVAVSSHSNLAGGFTGEFPWILGVFGLLATLVAAGLLEVASRRRDDALGLVAELKVSNVDLDAALAHQAKAEQSLRQAQRMEAVGQLAGGIAHDFNNLLQVIISYAGFLADSIDPETDIHRDVGEVQKAAERAAELTRQLLMFSRQNVTTPDSIDVNRAVLDAARLLRHTLGEDVNLHCDVAQYPCYVRVGAGEIEQMLMNLAINSGDAMKHGGELSINVDTVAVEASEAEAVGLAPGRYVRIGVEDNGEGMTPEVAAKAFEPFFTTKETGRGTGLGLSMVYGIANRWGGNVSVSTEVGVGTTFTLLFPVSTDAPEPSVVTPPASQPEGGRQTVLLVEDEEGVRRSTTRILQAAAYRVLQAENGAEASRVFDSESVDILVTDLVMPGGISGKALADRLRARTPDLPVVFMSGYSEETIAEKGVVPPSTAIVKKPFLPAELLEAMAQAVAERAPATR